MKIVIDLQGAQSESRLRGVGRYSLSLALALARLASTQHDVWLLLNNTNPITVFDIQHAFQSIIPSHHIRIFDVPTPVAAIDASNAWRKQAAEKIRDYFLQELNPDVVLVSSLFEGYGDQTAVSIGAFSSSFLTAVILYDLIPLLNQHDYLPTPTLRDYYFNKIDALKKADLFLAISEASRQEALQALALPEEQVCTISSAIDETFRPITLTEAQVTTLRRDYGITRDILMYAPGGFDARKNFEHLLQAYALLTPAIRQHYQLVIVSHIPTDKRLYLTQLRKQSKLSKDELIITGYVSNEALVQLYNLATLFIFPSTHEGFGLPVLEAMACGTPVIGSNRTSIPEVIGLSDALFDPFSPEDIAKKITHALNDSTFLEALRAHALQQSTHFSWEACAEKALAGLEKLVHEKRPTLNRQRKTHDELIEALNVSSPLATEHDLIQTAACLTYNTHRATAHFLLDVSVLVQRDEKSGIQRVVRSLLQELLTHPPHGYHVYLIYFDEQHQRYRYANHFTAAFTQQTPSSSFDDAVDFRQNDIYLALDLTAAHTPIVHDYHLHLRARGIQLYFIVYDLLFIQCPSWWPKGTSTVLKTWLESITETSTGLLCISKAVADEVEQWLQNHPPKRHQPPIVSFFHLGADVENSAPSKGVPADASHVLQQLQSKPSFLMVSTIEPRKGHAQTLSAFELLWAEGHDINLVIVGKKGWLVDALVQCIQDHPQLMKHLFWLEHVSDEYLEKIYQVSTCLIAASEGEGFGLPLIEAAKHQCPIIARNLPVFREIMAHHAHYFDGLAPDALSNAIKHWLTIPKAQLPDVTQITWITWKQSTEQLKHQIFPPIESLTSLS
jgi:glycosyltransferase involved in cell wall biosynthesis